MYKTDVMHVWQSLCMFDLPDIPLSLQPLLCATVDISV